MDGAFQTVQYEKNKSGDLQILSDIWFKQKLQCPVQIFPGM